MAGTRLLIATSFLVPFVAWTIFSFYAGIYRSKDLLLHRIFPKPGKIALKSSQKGTQFASMHIEPIKVMTNDQTVKWWEHAFHDFDDRIQVTGTDMINDLLEICDDPSIEKATKADLWICESQSHRDRPRLVLLKDTAAFYPLSANLHMQEFGSIFPTRSFHSSLSTVKIYVMIDENFANWKETMNSASQWIQSKEFWPCYKNVELDFQVSDIASNATLDEESQLLLLSTTLLSEQIFINANEKNDLTALYVTDRPCALIDEEGIHLSAAGFGNHIFKIVSHGTDIESSLDVLSNLLFSRCLGIPDNIYNVVDFEVKEGKPSFYEKLWMQRRLLVLYDATVTKALTVRQTLLSAPAATAVPASYAMVFFEACDWIDRARDLGNSGEYLLAISYLEKADKRLTELLEEPALAVPADFPIEQYAAIFAPLVFPLLVPLLATLFREYKRYRKLIQKDCS